MKVAVGEILATLATALWVGAIFTPWIAGRTARAISLADLFSSQPHHAGGLNSLAWPLAIAAMIAFFAAAVESAIAASLAGVLGLGTVVGWIVMEANRRAPADLSSADLQRGVWATIAGAVAVFVAALAFREKRVSRGSSPPA